MPGQINFGLVDPQTPAKIANSFYQGQQEQNQNALAAMQLQQGVMQNQVARYQIQKMMREDQALTQLAAQVKAAGGPDNLPAIADALIATGLPQHISAGIALKQKIQARQALKDAFGGQEANANPMNPNGQNPSVMAGAPGTTPPSNALVSPRGSLDPRVMNLLAQDEPITTKAAELLQNQLIEGRKVTPGRAGAPMWGQDAAGNPIIVGFNPKTETGQTMTPQGEIKTAPGFIQSATELGQIPLQEVTNPDGTKSFVPKAQLAAAAQQTTGTKLVAPDDATAKAWSDQLSAQGVPHAITVGPQGGGGLGNAPKFGQTQEQIIEQAGQKAERESFGRERGQLEASKPQSALAARTTIASLERLNNAAAELENHPGLSGITGKINQYSLLDVIPETRAARGLQNTMVRQTAVNALQAMRDASKTGGAVGQVTEREWPILQEQLAALDAAQGTGDYKAALKNLQNQMKGAMDRIKSAYQETYKEPLKYESIPYVQQGRTSEGKVEPQAIVNELRRRGMIK